MFVFQSDAERDSGTESDDEQKAGEHSTSLLGKLLKIDSLPFIDDSDNRLMDDATRGAGPVLGLTAGPATSSVQPSRIPVGFS